MEDKFASDHLILPGASSGIKMPKLEHREPLEDFTLEKETNPYFKQEILDELQDELESLDDESKEEILAQLKAEMEVDEDEMLEFQESSDAVVGRSTDCYRPPAPVKYDKAFKWNLIARLLPKKGLRPQVSVNEKKMRLKPTQVKKKKYWLGLGFTEREARFLAFHTVPKKTSIKDCYLLLEVFGQEKPLKDNRHKILNTKLSSKSRKGNPILESYPRIAISFEQKPTSGDFMDHINRLHIAIQKKLLREQVTEPLKISDSYLEGDILVLICCNEETKAWLENLVPSLPVWNYLTGEFMKVVTRKMLFEIPNFIVIAGQIPDRRESVTSEEVLETLSKENSPMTTERWVVSHMVTPVNNNLVKDITLFVDSESLSILKEFKWNLNYLGKKAHFHVKKGFTSLKWWGKARDRFHAKLYRKVGQEMKGEEVSGRRHDSKTVQEIPRLFYPKGKNPYKLDNRNKVNNQTNRHTEALQSRIQIPNFQARAIESSRDSFGGKSYNSYAPESRNETSFRPNDSGSFSSENPRSGFVDGNYNEYSTHTRNETQCRPHENDTFAGETTRGGFGRYNTYAPEEKTETSSGYYRYSRENPREDSNSRSYKAYSPDSRNETSYQHYNSDRLYENSGHRSHYRGGGERYQSRSSGHSRSVFQDQSRPRSSRAGWRSSYHVGSRLSSHDREDHNHSRNGPMWKPNLLDY